MANEQMTVEWVDQQLEELEAKHGHKVSAVSKTGVPTIAAICAVISMAIPILKFIKAGLFWKKKWQTVIQKLIDVAGKACE